MHRDELMSIQDTIQFISSPDAIRLEQIDALFATVVNGVIQPFILVTVPCVNGIDRGGVNLIVLKAHMVGEIRSWKWTCGPETHQSTFPATDHHILDRDPVRITVQKAPGQISGIERTRSYLKALNNSARGFRSAARWYGIIEPFNVGAVVDEERVAGRHFSESTSNGKTGRVRRCA